MQQARVGAVAVQKVPGVLRLEGAGGVQARVETRVEVDRPAVGMLRPAVAARNARQLNAEVLSSSMDSSSSASR
ncbi:hypothetical protein O980_08925 [Mycobacterium avium subsp. paratuberculosis 08-8281]|nr:hypothetical protein O980_08925 [Mycobacterium avium subsp. paratuberculosis 08-8281]